MNDNALWLSPPLLHSFFESGAGLVFEWPQAVEDLEELEILAKKCKSLLELDFSPGPRNGPCFMGCKKPFEEPRRE